MTEKWQEGLNNWDVWNISVNNTKRRIQRDVSSILVKASVEVEGEGKSMSFLINKEQWLKWDIADRFGRKTHQNDFYEDKCTTVKNRITRGKKQMQKHGFGSMGK